jgi:hypothetical protein
MRNLYEYELNFVSGGCDAPAGPCEPTPTCPPKDKGKGKTKNKGNNGFGNGPNDGVPGRSGFSDTDR